MTEHPHKRRVANLDLLELPGHPNQPTVILLHGFGADAFDLFSLNSVCKGPTWIFPQGPLEIPIAPGFSGRAWFDVDIDLLMQAIREQKFKEIERAFPPELNQARAQIEQLITELNIPRSKLILGGFSQGAVLATETVLSHPHPCAALLIFSGTLINEPNWRKWAPLHAKTPFFQSHGTHDHLLPLQKAEDLEQLLKASGWKGELHSFEGGHEIARSTLLQLSSFFKQLIT